MWWIDLLVIEKLSHLKLFAPSRWLITSSTRLRAHWHASNLEVIKWLRTSGTIAATYLRARKKWCCGIIHSRGIVWLGKLTNPTGINLLRRSNPKITSNALIYQTQAAEERRQSGEEGVESRKIKSWKDIIIQTKCCFYYGRRRIISASASIHLSTRSASFFSRMSHVYKRHEIWMSSFLFKRWYRIG